VNGEYWHAVADEEIGAGEECEIVEVHGLTMRVRPVSR
jgi:membrane protein implicated in regulation of membrane protease activity